MKNLDYYPSNRIKRCSHVIKRHLPLNSAILDVGCANGYFGEMLAKMGYRVYGVDIIKCRDECLSRGYVEVKDEHDVENGIPYPDESFDMVFAGEIIEHVWDTSFFLSEVNRVTKNGGHLLLTTPNLCYIGNIASILRGRQYWFVDYARDEKHGLGHITYYSPTRLKEHLKEFGFYPIKFFRNYISNSVVREFLIRPLRLSVLAISRLASTHGVFLIVLAKKSKRVRWHAR